MRPLRFAIGLVLLLLGLFELLVVWAGVMSAGCNRVNGCGALGLGGAFLGARLAIGILLVLLGALTIAVSLRPRRAWGPRGRFGPGPGGPGFGGPGGFGPRWARVCPTCGGRNGPHFAHCRYCGADLSSVAPGPVGGPPR